MTSTISKYFGAKAGTKRKPSSSSSASDLLSSPEEKRESQERKKARQRSDSIENMAMQETLCEIQASLTKLATKEDIVNLKQNMEKLTAALTMRVEKLEGEMFELQQDKDKLREEVAKLKNENKELRSQLGDQSKEATSLKADLNDHEQHGRSWNLRVYGVPEAQGQETVGDCMDKCVSIFTTKLGVPVKTTDVDIAHRSGRVTARGGRPRPIIIRFFSRRQRGLVLAARRKLKQTGVSVGEDLTQANYKLLRQVNSHSATLSAWSSNGKILAKLKNGKILKVDINSDIDCLFRREMT